MKENKENYQFGYPESCLLCKDINNDVKLQAKPSYQKGNIFRLMLIGQDPTIYKRSDTVQYVLMLEDKKKKSQIRIWLEHIFGENSFQRLTLYATNLVKCSFKKPPGAESIGAIRKLKPYFKECQKYLIKEILTFKPKLILTLGEPSHKLFCTILDNGSYIYKPMKESFNGKFIRARLNALEFDYSPCLHIKTFRVAKTYGNKVPEFEKAIGDYLRMNNS